MNGAAASPAVAIQATDEGQCVSDNATGIAAAITAMYAQKIQRVLSYVPTASRMWITAIAATPTAPISRAELSLS